MRHFTGGDSEVCPRVNSRRIQHSFMVEMKYRPLRYTVIALVSIYVYIIFLQGSFGIVLPASCQPAHYHDNPMD